MTATSLQQDGGPIGIHQLPVQNLGLPAHARRRGALFVAANMTRTIGCIYVGEIVDDPGRGFASFELDVEDDLRRRGWGTRLVLQAEAWARQAAFRCMIISVQPENDPALSLYDRLGYRLTWYERNRAEEPRHSFMHVLAKDLVINLSRARAMRHLADAA